MTTRRQSAASDQADVLRAHTAALEAHTLALNRNTEALLAHQDAMIESTDRINMFSAQANQTQIGNKLVITADISTMSLNAVYHESDCINGIKEVWRSDGRGGLRKDYVRC